MQELTVIPSRCFSYDNESNIMATEMSSLPSGDVFKTICEGNNLGGNGFQIRSHRTNSVVTVKLDHVDSREGDIQGWWFVPTLLAIKKYPHIRGLRVLVAND